jgi:hypothetical protein
VRAGAAAQAQRRQALGRWRGARGGRLRLASGGARRGRAARVARAGGPRQRALRQAAARGLADAGAGGGLERASERGAGRLGWCGRRLWCGAGASGRRRARGTCAGERPWRWSAGARSGLGGAGASERLRHADAAQRWRAVQGNDVQSDDVQGNNVQSDDVQGGDVQRMAVSPLGELRPRLSWCAGRSRAVREELQCSGCGRIRTGAAEPRMENVRGRRGEGSGRHGPNAGRPQSSRRWRSDYGAANWKEKLRSEGDGQA